MIIVFSFISMSVSPVSCCCCVGEREERQEGARNRGDPAQGVKGKGKKTPDLQQKSRNRQRELTDGGGCRSGAGPSATRQVSREAAKKERRNKWNSSSLGCRFDHRHRRSRCSEGEHSGDQAGNRKHSHTAPQTAHLLSFCSRTGTMDIVISRFTNPSLPSFLSCHTVCPFRVCISKQRPLPDDAT